MVRESIKLTSRQDNTAYESMNLDLVSDTEERILCAWAKAILVVGIIEYAISVILGIVYAVSAESFLFFLLAVAVGALLFVPFLLMWAMMRVIAKMSLNLSSSNSAISRLATIVSNGSGKKTETARPSLTITENDVKPATEAKKEMPAVTEKKSIVAKKERPSNDDVEKYVQSALDELNKIGGSEVDKLCRLMEMKDDGKISEEVYDIVITRIS